MTEAQLISHYALWAVVIVLSGVVLVLTRQLGVLHERIAPAGALALSSGPEAGQPAPRLDARALDGTVHEIGGAGASGRPLLLFFLSPSCPVCLELHPVVRRLAAQNGVDLLFASDGDELDHEGFVAMHDLGRGSYVVMQELGMKFGVAKLPYAVLLDAEGVVRAQGLVNTREHVESLFLASELGVASIQDFLQKSALDVRMEEQPNGLG